MIVRGILPNTTRNVIKYCTAINVTELLITLPLIPIISKDTVAKDKYVLSVVKRLPMKVSYKPTKPYTQRSDINVLLIRAPVILRTLVT